ncbi:MAG: nuclear transport factor 2 family protein [Candidatus Limnocylindrales bacterium]
MPSLTPGDGQDLLARLKTATERRDVDLAVALFREDAEYRPDPFEEPRVGANAIRESLNADAEARANVEWDAERIWISGGTVLASWHGAHTQRADGERIRTRGFLSLELDDERLISRLRGWTLARAVGRDSSLSVERPA